MMLVEIHYTLSVIAYNYINNTEKRKSMYIKYEY